MGRHALLMNNCREDKAVVIARQLTMLLDGAGQAEGWAGAACSATRPYAEPGCGKP